MDSVALAVDRAPAAPDCGNAGSLRPLFRPRLVAVVGASRDPGRIGRRALHTLLRAGFQGPVFPLNPQAPSVSGLRAYPTVRDVPEPVDLLLRVSRMAEEIPEAAELDLNPVFALPPGQGCRIVDVRLCLENARAVPAAGATEDGRPGPCLEPVTGKLDPRNLAGPALGPCW